MSISLQPLLRQLVEASESRATIVLPAHCSGHIPLKHILASLRIYDHVPGDRGHICKFLSVTPTQGWREPYGLRWERFNAACVGCDGISRIANDAIVLEHVRVSRWGFTGDDAETRRWMTWHILLDNGVKGGGRFHDGAPRGDGHLSTAAGIVWLHQNRIVVVVWLCVLFELTIDYARVHARHGDSMSLEKCLPKVFCHFTTGGHARSVVADEGIKGEEALVPRPDGPIAIDRRIKRPAGADCNASDRACPWRKSC